MYHYTTLAVNVLRIYYCCLVSGMYGAVVSLKRTAMGLLIVRQLYCYVTLSESFKICRAYEKY